MTEANDVAVLKKQVDDLWTWRYRFIDDISSKLSSIEDAIRKEIAGRPTWFTTTLIAILSSACVGLLVQDVTRR